MRRLVEFTMPGGGTLLAETEETTGPGPQPAGVGDRAIGQASMGLDKAISKIRPLAELLVSELQAITQRPDQFAVEFGVKFNATAGIIVANTAVEGNCKITLSWKNPE
jgi:hypothetical protein